MEDQSASLAEFVKHEVCGITFDIVNRYSNLEVLEMGGLGLGSVCSATDSIAASRVAIKKIPAPFQSPESAKQTFREIRLLRQLKHDNVVALLDLFISPLDDVYLVSELLSTNLEKIMRKGPLDSQFSQYFFYQIMRGLKYIHSAGVIHRDLKPTNILVNENCDLKICDFGLARSVDFFMTGYVTTRFYRAPETMLTWKHYDEQVDVWSAACILAEMIEGKPLFPGKDAFDQFMVISSVLGSVPQDMVDTITTKNTLNLLQSSPPKERQDLKEYLRKASPEGAIDILDKMLVYNPRVRLDTSAALSHPYLASYHDPNDEPVADRLLNPHLENQDGSGDWWRVQIYSEIMDHLGAPVS
ncbi:mitogen-activated protein kinase HOG1 [Penicillium chermesinum]|uniref:mitogen-activated protein kinase n=1 Tax=Penicillium chermesinum TaxID=63820 RepID=A0A9W9PI86_9EURO|nr:mitogen-activated protein kinase HOG1 [Penicillium chermesinum]KAJ5247184.1 mitogen-activated protein kinase HOG1 [Penicillium chermesinum]KAJ6145427.1 mitogen-activated protein kinase HOG1 [Penicillium chermesinum]